MLGTLLRNRYRIDAKLGEGGMGVVYRAHDSLLQRPVAIKTLSPALFGEEGARRRIREAQSAAGRHHAHNVPPLWAGGVCDWDGAGGGADAAGGAADAGGAAGRDCAAGTGGAGVRP